MIGTKQKKVIYVVGMGPGNEKQLTIQAKEILEQCDVIVGYTVYIDLLRAYFPEKEFYTTPMKQEIERCREAFKMVQEGKTVAMVCSGDAGVYGMASPMLELLEEFDDIDVQVIPGVTAALAGSAVLGAPLAHDFAVISLSDLLTPKETIEKRILCAGHGDFAICIYNPSSKKRSDYLMWACDLLLTCRSPKTVCAAVRQIGRDGQKISIMTLEELRTFQADMFTTIFIGNESTKQMAGRMVTPRGYRCERKKDEA